MSIGKQVAEAIDKMQAQDPEGALYALCSAIDATATKEYGKRGKASYKQFVSNNFGLITAVGFGPKVLNLRLEYSHPDLPPSADGTYPVQDIFYVAVRCNLYHETELPTNIKFIDSKRIACDNSGGIILSDSLIYGLIMAVVAAPVNSGESSPNPNLFNIGDIALPISKLWGRRQELVWLLEAINEGDGMRKMAAGSSSAPGAVSSALPGQKPEAPATPAS
jgi:hypothetical protein